MAGDGTVIDVSKQWEVVCHHCGVVDAPPTKEEAMRIAREHAKTAHRNR